MKERIISDLATGSASGLLVTILGTLTTGVSASVVTPACQITVAAATLAKIAYDVHIQRERRKNEANPNKTPQGKKKRFR